MNKKIISILLSTLLMTIMLPTTIALTTENINENNTNVGYSINEHITAIIIKLKLTENITSFTALIGFRTIYSERDDGGIAVFVDRLLLRELSWEGDIKFQGIMTFHFIRGIISYRVE